MTWSDPEIAIVQRKAHNAPPPMHGIFSGTIPGSIVRIVEPGLGRFGLADMEPLLTLADEMRRRGFFKSLFSFPRPPDEPFVHAYYALSGERNEAGGCSFTEPAAALGAALGETFERYLWRNGEHLFGRSRFASAHELGPAALPPESFEGFSSGQRREKPGLAIDSGTRIRWISGRSIVHPWRAKWCPLQQVSGTFASDMAAGKHREPIARSHSTAGLATAANNTAAITIALNEVIEREAFAVAYAHRLAPPRIDLASLAAQSEEIAHALESIRRARLEVTLVALPTDFPVHVVCALLVDHTGKGPALCVGARASFDLIHAVRDALKESIFVRYHLRIPLPARDVASDVRDMRERLLFWEKTGNLRHIDFLLRGPVVDVRTIASPHAALDERRQLRLLRKHLKRLGIDGCVIDMVGGSIGESLPFRSVFAVVPGLHPLQISTDPEYRGGARLHELPHKLGYEPAKTLNFLPNPFP